MPGHGALLKPSVQLSGVFDCELDLGPSSLQAAKKFQ